MSTDVPEHAEEPLAHGDREVLDPVPVEISDGLDRRAEPIERGAQPPARDLARIADVTAD